MPVGKRRNGLRQALLLTIALGGPVASAPAGAQPLLEPQDCRLDRVSVPARCGTLAVFEERAAGAGRTIELEIVVVPAVADSAEPDPLFFLAGGPGQAATELAGPLARVLARVRRTRDLVFVGYFEAVRSDVPTLLLSGALDPVTPPRWGEEVLRGLGNARHVVAPGAGHGLEESGVVVVDPPADPEAAVRNRVCYGVL